MAEIVSPGGSLEKIKTAVLFGADAVYVGLEHFSLRGYSASLSLKELKSAVQFAHKHSVKVYLAANIFTYDSDYSSLLGHLQKAISYGIDAVIVSDPGLVFFINSQLDQKPKIHLSTQASTTNSNAVKFWKQQGVTRIVLARELSYEQIKQIKQTVPDMEIEVFVHGAMCMAYSGRCLLSETLTGRSANRGECAQPCRWPFHLKEKSREDETFEIQEDEQGTYILNSRDLCLIEHLPKLIDAGIDAFKIEGRMKPSYYNALITKTYKEVLSKYLYDRDNFTMDTKWIDRLNEVSHRPYTSGFLFKGALLQSTKNSSYIKLFDFVGIVKAYNKKDSRVVIDVRNRLQAQDSIEFLDPAHPDIRAHTPHEFVRDTGEIIKTAHNQYRISFTLPFEVSKNSIVRIRIQSL